MNFTTPQYIVIHHSLTEDSKTVSWQAIRNYHVNQRGWNDIGYQYGIELVNDRYEILVGRMEGAVGAHTIGRNLDSIGICCVGNYDEDPPDQTMIEMLSKLCISICQRYRISIENVRGHSYYAPDKTCPGRAFPLFNLQDHLKDSLRYS
jgi:hypothetical protein